jgi:hypothetical protein
MVELTSYLDDGTRGYPLDVAMYKPAFTLKKAKKIQNLQTNQNWHCD